jgi:pimeloyl-ACP methyl ester carboxylesterase
MNFELLIHRWLRIPYSLHVRSDKTIGKPKVTLVFLHGLGGTGEMWKATIAKLKLTDVRIVTLDLIGFGKSAKPEWATYSAGLQAKSLRLTMAKLFIRGKVVIVGHSLGSLVAIELLRRYPYLAKALVLCSPPLYYAPNDTGLIRPERALRKLFAAMEANKGQFVAVSEFATKYKVVVNKSFNVTRDNVDIFLNTLHAAISNQTAMNDITKLNVPIEIMHGLVDPLVIAPNLYAVAKENKLIHVNEVAAGHEVTGLYEAVVAKTITKTVQSLS